MDPTPTTSDNLPVRRADFASLPEALDYAARGRAGLNFYTARGDLVTALPYAELRERAVALARGLVRAGLPRGARLLLIADTDPDFAVLFVACHYAGILAVPVAVPTALGGREAYVAGLRRQLAGCGAVAASAPAALLPLLREAAAGLEVGLVGAPADFYALPDSGVDPRPFGASDPGYLQYSSGSTRFPLGVDIPQRALASNCRIIAQSGLDARAGDRCVSWLPLYHDMGLVGFMLTPMFVQMSIDYLATRDFARRPLMWPTLIARNGGTLSYSPSFGYDLCARRAESVGGTSALDLRCWRAAGIGGDMIQPGVLRRFAERFAPSGFRASAFVPSYGMAETTLAISFAPLGKGAQVDIVDRQRLAANGIAASAPPGEDGAARGFVLCGRPLPEHAVEVRDADGRPLPDRRLGRLFVRGPSVMAGYFGEPEATARVLGADGWLDTGDLGYTVEGAIVITGRSKDLIIVNGRNIWPQDLEWAVEALPGLRRGDVAAFSVEAAEEAERVVVLVQCRLSDPQARAALTREAAAVVRRTAAVECEVVPVPPHGLPQTSSGKLSRSRAKDNYLRGIYAAAGPSEPRPTQRSAVPLSAAAPGE